MNKRFYEKPSMEVLEMSPCEQLLVGSIGGLESPTPFDFGGNPLDDE